MTDLRVRAFCAQDVIGGSMSLLETALDFFFDDIVPNAGFLEVRSASIEYKSDGCTDGPVMRLNLTMHYKNTDLNIDRDNIKLMLECDLTDFDADTALQCLKDAGEQVLLQVIADLEIEMRYTVPGVPDWAEIKGKAIATIKAPDFEPTFKLMVSMKLLDVDIEGEVEINGFGVLGTGTLVAESGPIDMSKVLDGVGFEMGVLSGTLEARVSNPTPISIDYVRLTLDSDWVNPLGLGDDVAVVEGAQIELQAIYAGGSLVLTHISWNVTMRFGLPTDADVLDVESEFLLDLPSQPDDEYRKKQIPRLGCKATTSEITLDKAVELLVKVAGLTTGWVESERSESLFDISSLDSGPLAAHMRAIKFSIDAEYSTVAEAGFSRRLFLDLNVAGEEFLGFTFTFRAYIEYNVPSPAHEDADALQAFAHNPIQAALDARTGIEFEATTSLPSWLPLPSGVSVGDITFSGTLWTDAFALRGTLPQLQIAGFTVPTDKVELELTQSSISVRAPLPVTIMDKMITPILSGTLSQTVLALSASSLPSISLWGFTFGGNMSAVVTDTMALADQQLKVWLLATLGILGDFIFTGDLSSSCLKLTGTQLGALDSDTLLGAFKDAVKVRITTPALFCIPRL